MENATLKEVKNEHDPEGVGENEDVKILWDVTILCDREIKGRKPDIDCKEQEWNEKSCAIIDVAIHGNIRINKKRKEKLKDTRN